MDLKSLGELLGMAGGRAQADGAQASEGIMTAEYTVCVVMDGDRLLLKYANRGISSGKLNFPGGKVDAGEAVIDSVRREVREETGLALGDVFYHGKKDCYEDNGPQFRRIHVLSSKFFSGTLRSSDEGEIAWFDRSALPLDKMWKDVSLWLDHVYAGRKFDITMQYSNSRGDAIEYAHVALKERGRA